MQTIREEEEGAGHVRLHSTSSNQEVKRTLAELTGGHGPWQLTHWLAFAASALCLSLQSMAPFPMAGVGAGMNATRTDQNSTSCLLAELSDSYWKQDDTSCTSAEQCTCLSMLLFSKLLFAMGMMTSGITAAYLMRRCGRRSPSVVSGFLLVACTVATGWAQNSAAYLVLRFFTSLMATDVYLLLAFSLVEFVAADFSLLYALSGHLGWNVARFAQPLVMWLTHDWMQYSLVLSAIAVVLFLQLCCLPESVEVYISRGLWGQAQKVVTKAALTNSIPTGDIVLFADWANPSHKVTAAAPATEKKKESETNPTKEKIRNIFQLSFLFLVGFSSSFFYWATLWLLEWLVAGQGVQLAMVATTEVAATLILLMGVCFVPLKRLWAATHALGAVAMLVLYARVAGAPTFVQSHAHLLTTFFTSSSWTLFLTQTVFRSDRERALLSCVAICAGMLTAAMTDLQKFSNWNSKLLVVYSIPNLALGLCTAFMPDRYFNL